MHLHNISSLDILLSNPAVSGNQRIESQWLSWPESSNQEREAPMIRQCCEWLSRWTWRNTYGRRAMENHTTMLCSNDPFMYLINPRLTKRAAHELWINEQLRFEISTFKGLQRASACYRQWHHSIKFKQAHYLIKQACAIIQSFRLRIKAKSLIATQMRTRGCYVKGYARLCHTHMKFAANRQKLQCKHVWNNTHTHKLCLSQ